MTGEQLSKWSNIYNKWRTNGDKTKYDLVNGEFKATFKKFVKSDPLATHGQYGFIEAEFMNIYQQTYLAHKEIKGATEADKIARATAWEAWDKGTKSDKESERTGVFKYTPGDTPFDARFTDPKFDSRSGNPRSSITTSIIQARREYGPDFVNSKNALFTSGAITKFESTTRAMDIPDHMIQHAMDAVAVTPYKDTWQQVIRSQIEASDGKVPGWLIEVTDGQKETLEKAPHLESQARRAFNAKPGDRVFAENDLKTANYQYNVPVSTDGVMRQVGITGEKGQMGRGDEHHIDVKLSQSLPIEQRIMRLDEIAWMYHSEGRVIEFSNPTVAGLQWDVMWSDAKKVEVYQAVAAAHGHSTHSGWDSLDYYVPSKGRSRWHNSAEFAPIYVPTVQGGQMVQKTGGGYGFNSEIYDSYGNLIIRIGHGRMSAPMNKPGGMLL